MLLRRQIETSLERVLRAERPEPPARLIEALARRCAPAPRLGRRVAAAAVLSTALVAGLAAVGGLGNAVSKVSEAARTSAIRYALTRTQSELTVQTQNAALDQYAPPTPTPAGPAPTDEVVVFVPPGTPGSIVVTLPGGQAVTVRWSAETFATAVVLRVDPTPSLASTALVGTGNQLVGVAITLPTGEPFAARLPAPLEIVFPGPPRGFVPVISSDGISFRAVLQLPLPPPPESLDDAYFVDSGGDVHLLTRHVTIFAVLYRANVTVSESGRRLKQAGSGLFGDPTRIHVGPPVVREVPRRAGPVKLRGKRGHLVPFAFFLDEQAAVVVSIFDGDRKLLLAMDGSSFRGRPLRGIPRKNLKIVVLRPGRIGMAVRVPGRLLEPGRTYRIRVWAVDYDGNRVIRFIRFRVP